MTLTFAGIINSGIIEKTKIAKESYKNSSLDEEKTIGNYSNEIYLTTSRENESSNSDLEKRITALEDSISQKANYKVSGIYTLTTQSNQMTYGKITNLEDNISMVDSTENYKFVAPITGYYIMSWQLPEFPDQNTINYHATYIYLNGNVIGGSDRQDNSSNVRVPVNETTMLKLSAGDKVWLGIYLSYTASSVTKNGKASFALIN